MTQAFLNRKIFAVFSRVLLKRARLTEIAVNYRIKSEKQNKSYGAEICLEGVLRVREKEWTIF